MADRPPRVAPAADPSTDHREGTLMAHLPGKFVWFEHLSNDIAAARAFYEKLFGWNTEMMAMSGSAPYAVIHNGDAAIGGYAQARAGAPTQWMSYLSVQDVDSSYKAALAAGAKSVAAPFDVGSVGRMATISDPTGGVFSLWRSAQGDPAEVETTPAGGWIWNELSTQDEKTALAFYEKVFTFDHDAMQMPQGTYYVLKQGGKGRAGLCRATSAATPTMWLPYVAVADADAQTETAKRLGANVVVAPSDIPGVGRFAVFVDPQGAAIAILKPNPTMA
jgi:predicted enzyme related to lactoylglutathione lyase